MSTNCVICNSSTSTEGYQKGCNYCTKNLSNTQRCIDPLCNKWVLPKEQGKSDFICPCVPNYWSELKSANLTKQPIDDRKCAACGELCKKVNGKSVGFCEKHIQTKPNLDAILYCIVCGTDKNVFTPSYPVGVCTNESCRNTLQNHKF